MIFENMAYWPSWMVAIFVALALFELVLKGISLWKCGRSNQSAWFIFILIFNTAGILPLVYLLFFQKHEQDDMKQKKKAVKKKK